MIAIAFRLSPFAFIDLGEVGFTFFMLTMLGYFAVLIDDAHRRNGK